MFNMKGELSLFDFFKQFPDEQTCIDFLEKQLHPESEIVSPLTGGKAYRLKRPGYFKCKDTKKQFSIRYGTIFEESRLPLQKWFLAIFVIHSLKKGISSVQLAKYLDVTQKTAWFMLHRVRYAVEHGTFQRPLEGTVEIDEHYSGGSKRGGKRGRGAENKTPVFGMVERDGGEIRCEAVPNVKSATLTPIIRENVDIDARVMTDEFAVYNSLPRHGYSREVVNHGRKEYVRGSVHTNTIEGFWSHFKAGIKAIQIHVSPKHLNRYCKEYELRYNHRKISDFERFEAWFDRCSARLTYADLIA